MFGFEEENKGHSSGLRVMFINKMLDICFRLHKPHPNNLLKNYQVKKLFELLKKLEEN